jgi:hypothetical protein
VPFPGHILSVLMRNSELLRRVGLPHFSAHPDMMSSFYLLHKKKCILYPTVLYCRGTGIAQLSYCKYILHTVPSMRYDGRVIRKETNVASSSCTCTIAAPPDSHYSLTLLCDVQYATEWVYPLLRSSWNTFAPLWEWCLPT